ncbi:hypothetical protein OK351_13835 [Glutamicibacter sp. MNS18]|uniref:hypothetical protein n=1 Tax=Glutamicibacter sp. MNS18 TaxID=2989817 RepID=UPI002236A40F|nr:hypothetical protein [Glutamicibacter sp. MNS18]MCW4466575.1 hypothetical protein [Glutamicibacter sp. MNS18]
MYSPEFQGPSDAEHRANNRTRFTTMLASVSMLTLGLSLGTAGVSGTAAATSAVVQPSTQVSAAPAAPGSASTQTPRSQDEDSEADGSDS